MGQGGVSEGSSGGNRSQACQGEEDMGRGRYRMAEEMLIEKQVAEL